MPEPSKVPHKDRWPSGNVDEFHMYQCPRCKEWKRVKASIVHKPIYCSVCGVFMQPRGLIQREK